MISLFKRLFHKCSFQPLDSMYTHWGCAICGHRYVPEHYNG